VLIVKQSTAEKRSRYFQSVTRTIKRNFIEAISVARPSHSAQRVDRWVLLASGGSGVVDVAVFADGSDPVVGLVERLLDVGVAQ
jgi:ribosomal protein L1